MDRATTLYSTNTQKKKIHNKSEQRTIERGRASISCYWVSNFIAAAGFLGFLSNGEIRVVFNCWVSFFTIVGFLGFLLDGELQMGIVVLQIKRGKVKIGQERKE